MTELLDPRLHAFREDLADIRLEGKVSAGRFVQGEPARIAVSVADVLAAPNSEAGLQTQFLRGHEVQVFERADGWAWVQQEYDGYVGYVREDDLQSAETKPTHMVRAPRTFLYSQPDLKSPRSVSLSMGAMVTLSEELETRGTRYGILDTGEALILDHVLALGEWQTDYVAVAETLLHAPYLWGGTSAFGIDCSGLVSLAMMLCGRPVVRDSDMQAAHLGAELETDFSDLRRGDLVFWKGHVGVMADPLTLVHANGHTMSVAHEPLADAIKRIGYLYGQPTGARRPSG